MELLLKLAFSSKKITTEAQLANWKPLVSQYVNLCKRYMSLTWERLSPERFKETVIPVVTRGVKRSPEIVLHTLGSFVSLLRYVQQRNSSICTF